MTLAALTWKQLPTQNLAINATIDQILNAIYTAFTSTTYADGVTRTSGSGVAWTFSRYQATGAITEAIYGVPVTNTLNQKVIIAGSASTYTPVMLTGCSYATSNLFVGLAKNAGNFSSWTAASPFTSGQFSGYGDVMTRDATYPLAIKCYESQDGVLCLIYHLITGGGVTSSFMAGGIIDPQSTDTTLDAESDGKVYALSVSGTTLSGSYGVGLHSSTAGGLVGHYSAASLSNATNKFAAFTPGGATMLSLPRIGSFYIGAPLQSKSGKYAKIPCLVGYNASFSDATGYTTHTIFAGRVREVWMFGDMVGGQILRTNGTDVGYTLSNSLTIAGDAFLLTK
jgi:hypothetical protein